MIKYYGGKKWLGKIIKNFLPKCECETFVDLFVGGGSISDALSDTFPHIVINDKDANLINFYSCVKNVSIDEITSYFETMRESTTFDDVRTFRYKLESDFHFPNLERAFLYYSCVYCGYGGKPYASPTQDKYNNYKKRDIRKDLTFCKSTLSRCEVRCEDYHDVKLQNAVYYCDPPYAKVGDNTYYGSKGKAHKEFDHIDFYNYILEISKSNFVMISYEDSEYIRNLYRGWYIVEIPKKTVNYNPGKDKSETLTTNELLILNYIPVSFEGLNEKLVGGVQTAV